MKVTILVLVALAATGLLRNRSAALRHWILAIAILCAGALPLVEPIAPSWPLSLKQASFAELTAESRSAAPATLPSHPSSAPAARRPEGSFDQSAATRVRGWAIASVLTPIWIAGTAIGLLVLAVGLSRLAWIRSRSGPVTSGNWLRLLDQISREYRLRRKVTLLRSDHPSMLATWGFASPTIVVPAVSVRWPDALVRSVLCHELAHISRGDWIVQMSVEIVRAVYWFNPIVWFACGRLRLESERACDEVVLRSGVEGSVYASHLLGLARALNQRHRLFPAPAMARSSSLHKRVTTMLNDAQNRTPISRFTRVATVVTLVVVAAAIAAAQVFATFSGSIADPQGAVLPGVHVTLSNADRQTKYDAQSNRRGEFEFVGLPPGDYLFEVRVPGFKAYQASLTMAGADVRRAITLQIGSLQETVIVADGGDTASRSVETGSARANPPCPAAAPAGDPPIGGNVRPPAKIRDVRPQYPASLRGTGAEGTVVLDARVGLDGFIKDPRVREPANRDFANALIAAVNQWQFDSTLLNCVPIEPAITVTGHFQRRR
jgi:beta-lactamase regulating signal transducer with metallopeptidase domain